MKCRNMELYNTLNAQHFVIQDFFSLLLCEIVQMKMTDAHKEYQENTRRALRKISYALCRNNHPTTGFVKPELYATFPLKVSYLPCQPDEAIDFGTRFTEPFDEDAFEELFRLRAGANGERLFWPTKEMCSDASSWAQFYSGILSYHEKQSRSIFPKSKRLIEFTDWEETNG